MNTEQIEKKIVEIITEAKIREQVFTNLQDYLPRHHVSECFLKSYYWLDDDNKQVKVYNNNSKEVKIFKHIDHDLRKKDIYLNRISLYVLITNSFGCVYKIKIGKSK